MLGIKGLNRSHNGGSALPPLTVISNGTILDSKYVTGTAYLSVTETYSSVSSSVSFNLLTLGKYKKATVSLLAYYGPNDTGLLSVGNTTFDGQNYDGGSYQPGWNFQNTTHYGSFVIQPGTHTIYASATHYSDTENNSYTTTYVTSLVLTDE